MRELYGTFLFRELFRVFPPCTEDGLRSTLTAIWIKYEYVKERQKIGKDFYTSHPPKHEEIRETFYELAMNFKLFKKMQKSKTYRCKCPILDISNGITFRPI
jgi:hypothetical protein